MGSYPKQISTILGITIQSFRKWTMDTRIYLLFLVVLLTIFSRTRELTHMVHTYMDCAIN